MCVTQLSLPQESAVRIFGADRPRTAEPSRSLPAAPGSPTGAGGGGGSGPPPPGEFGGSGGGGGGRSTIPGPGTGNGTGTGGKGRALIPDDRQGEGEGGINTGDGPKGDGTKRKKFPGQDDEGGVGGGGLNNGEGEDEDRRGGGLGGTEDDDDGDKRIADDEGDPTDDTEDKIKKREEEEGPTTSPHRIVSPLIRAVQGERQINRRGRNSLFINQGSRAQAGNDRVIGDRASPRVRVSPIESGLIPLRR